jgi:hypothetical protein
MKSKAQDVGVLRRLSGTVTSAGVVNLGTGFSVVRTGVGAYQITFTEPFRGVISVTGSAQQGALSYIVAFGNLTNGSVNAYCFTTSTNAATDVGFSFTVEGLAR